MGGSGAAGAAGAGATGAGAAGGSSSCCRRNRRRSGGGRFGAVLVGVAVADDGDDDLPQTTPDPYDPTDPTLLIN